MTTKTDQLYAALEQSSSQAAKAWVREQLEANEWKVGGIGAFFG